jgi:hypothetical protein
MAKHRTRLFAIGIISAGLLILIVGVGYFISSIVTPNLDHPLLPNFIDELPQSKLTTGQEALYEINRLHGKPFPLARGAVGIYGLENQAIIWVAVAADSTKATEISLSMRDRIAEGNSPFSPTDVLRFENRTVYTLEGLGQKHFYFQSRELIVWAAVNAALYKTALQQVLDYYP